MEFRGENEPAVVDNANADHMEPFWVDDLAVSLIAHYLLASNRLSESFPWMPPTYPVQ